jgi:hypothetical protein
MAVEAVTGDVIPAPVAPATPPPAPSPPPGDTAALAMTPQAEARGKIEQLKADPAWLKRYHDGDISAWQEMQTLIHREHSLAPNTIITGAPPPPAQYAEEGRTLRAQGIPENIVQQYENPASRITAKEYADTKALKARLFADPAWSARYFNKDHEAMHQFRLISINEALATRGLLP